MGLNDREPIAGSTYEGHPLSTRQRSRRCPTWESNNEPENVPSHVCFVRMSSHTPKHKFVWNNTFMLVVWFTVCLTSVIVNSLLFFCTYFPMPADGEDRWMRRLPSQSVSVQWLRRLCTRGVCRIIACRKRYVRGSARRGMLSASVAPERCVDAWVPPWTAKQVKTGYHLFSYLPTLHSPYMASETGKIWLSSIFLPSNTPFSLHGQWNR